jgi:pyrophosphatase PpaX
VQGILFDLDGTLLDTADLIINSFKHTFRVHEGREASEAEICPYLSMTLANVFKDKGENAQQFIDTYRDYHFKYYEQTVMLFDGAKETLAKLNANGIKFAAVTSRRTASARRGLEITGVLKYFSSIVGNDRSEKHKPDAEPLLLAMEEMRLLPKDCVMVGDSASDILAGKNAHTKTAAVCWTRSSLNALLELKPDYIIETPRDLIKFIE